jgi:arginase family enzyme
VGSVSDHEESVIGREAMSRIAGGFDRAAELAHQSSARRERRVEDLLAGDVPTFMEFPLARKASQLIGAHAVVLGFGYEGVTIKTPSLAAPPTTARPVAGSVYWRMGADEAPAAIRRYSLFYSIHHNRGYYPEIDRDRILFDRLKVLDYGDIAVVPEDTDETLRRAEARVADVVGGGALPIVLGGDHTTPTPVLRAILRPRPRPIGLIVFDAHLDLVHGGEPWGSNQWSKVLESGKIDPRNMVLIGIRSNRSTWFEKQAADQLGIGVITIDQVKESGIRQAMAAAIERATDGTDGVYVSLDIDAMEPTLVPGQKAPEIWGLTIDEIMYALRQVSRLPLVGFDICELSPTYDVHGLGAQFCARAVVEILAGLASRADFAG